MNDRRRRTVLDGSGPNRILHCSAPGVDIDTVLAEYLCNQQVVVSFFDVLVLSFLKSVGFSGRNLFPHGGELCGARSEAGKILKPWETGLSDKPCRHAHLRRHLIRTVRDAAGISGAG